MTPDLNIGFLIYPHCTQLDFVGPAQVLANLDGAALHYVWKVRTPVHTDTHVAVLPTHTFDDCPPLDLLLVPGGPGQQKIMFDPAVIRWLKVQGSQARWLASVCSGSLLLGAAELLSGYSAASHWNYRHYLRSFGATPDERRVVVDRNRFTGGGVTAGIDLALRIVVELRGESVAKDIQLLIEYAPEPPFNSGRPEQADPGSVERVQARLNEAVAALEDDDPELNAS